MIAAEIHNGHVYHHQLQSRRVKLTTGNAISMQLCLLLLFDQVKNTQKLKRYEPKCPTKNQSMLPFFGGRGSRKFRPEAEIFWIFSIEVAPYCGQ